MEQEKERIAAARQELNFDMNDVLKDAAGVESPRTSQQIKKGKKRKGVAKKPQPAQNHK